MAKCAGIKADGTRCKGTAMKGEQYCYMHHPDNAEQIKAYASKGGGSGGRSRPRVELSNVRGQLQDLVSKLQEGEVETKVAAVAGQLLSYMVRCLQVELQAREQEELEQRLDRIEQRLDEQESQRHTPNIGRYPSRAGHPET